ncbi:MAG: transposase [Pseudomonadota bacterium]|nr:transposase [Pseudomonadota bacterium]
MASCDASFSLWRRKLGGMEMPDAKPPKALEAENVKLKKTLTEAMLHVDGLKVVASGNSRPAVAT